MIRNFLVGFSLSTTLALACVQPLAATWRSEGPFLGTVVDVAFDPHVGGRAFAAAANGGVFKSDDGGRSWQHVGGPLGGGALTWLEVDPGKKDVLWLGVDDPGQPALWRSDDAGLTWGLVDDDYRGELMNLHPTGYRISFAPSRPSDVWIPSSNLHYRSRDSGKTWNDFRVGNHYIRVLAVDPKNPDTVYAGGHSGGEDAHLMRSDDGGKTWKGVSQGLKPTLEILRIDPASGTIYALGGSNSLVRSTDGGHSFSDLALPVSSTDDVFNLRIVPGSPSKIFVATEKGLFRSDDEGKTWRRSDENSGRFVFRNVAADPAQPRTLLAASAGDGVFRSEDGGQSWSPSARGLAAAWIKEIYASSRSNGLFAQTSSSFLRLEAQGWTELDRAFGGTVPDLDGVFFDAQSPPIVWAHSAASAFSSSDGGATFRPLELKEKTTRELFKGDFSTPGFRSLAQDPSNAKVLFAGASSPSAALEAVWKSSDGGKTWKKSGAGLEAATVSQLLCLSSQELLAVVGKSLFYSSDGAGTWSAIGSGLPATELRDLALDPTRAGQLYVATEQGLFVSADRGASFTKVGEALAEEDVEAVVSAPDGTVFAGSFRGVFKSRDGGKTWISSNGNLPNRDVRALAISGPAPTYRLWVGTAGNGVFSTPLP
jgi:photosystem II stability/assembly factor-like uncharacterized protein